MNMSEVRMDRGVGDGKYSAHGMTFVKIPAGTFVMGSPESELGRHWTEKQHTVLISKDFYLSPMAVTVKLWRLFAKETGYETEAEEAGGSWKLVANEKWRWQKLLPKYDWIMAEDCVWHNPGFRQNEDHPVTCVSWNDVQHFIDWLNTDIGGGFRLPTEAEWEYACRAGSDDLYSFGSRLSKAQGNIHRSILGAYLRYPCLSFLHQNKRTSPVHSHTANRWGLIAMHGNVWEWCMDRSVEPSKIPITYTDHVKDPLGIDGVKRVLKGGSWAYSKKFCRSAHRRIQLPDYRASGIGFRLARSLPE